MELRKRYIQVFRSLVSIFFLVPNYYENSSSRFLTLSLSLYLSQRIPHLNSLLRMRNRKRKEKKKETSFYIIAGTVVAAAAVIAAAAAAAAAEAGGDGFVAAASTECFWQQTTISRLMHLPTPLPLQPKRQPSQLM